MPLKLPIRQQGHVSRVRSPQQEKDLAKRVGGQRVIASGRLDTKGDARKRGVLRIEAKVTQKQSFSVTLEMWKKIEEAALPTGEMPVICIEFLDLVGKSVAELCVCPSYLLDIIVAK